MQTLNCLPQGGVIGTVDILLYGLPVIPSYRSNKTGYFTILAALFLYNLIIIPKAILF